MMPKKVSPHYLHIMKLLSMVMWNPFRKTQDAFSENWMIENRILSEFMDSFNMSKRTLKKEISRINKEHEINEENEKSIRREMDGLERNQGLLQTEKRKLEKDHNAKTSTKLRSVNLDISTNQAEIDTLQDKLTNFRMKNVDLRSTRSLIECIINGTYRTTKQATSKFIPSRHDIPVPGDGRLPHPDDIDNPVPETPSQGSIDGIRDPVEDYEEGM